MSYNEGMNSSHASTHSCFQSCLARITQGFYYLALGAWFGAMVMLAVSAATTFKTVRLYQPQLQLAPFNDPEFQGKQPNVLAGSIVGNSLRGLKAIEIICAVVVVAVLLLQSTLLRNQYSFALVKRWNLLRIALIVLPILILLLDLFWITPSIHEQRQIMWDLANSEPVRQLAQDQFSWYHKLSERVVGLSVLLVAAATVISPFALTRRHDLACQK